MPHPNNITSRLEDLFDGDLTIVRNFVWTLENLSLAKGTELETIDMEIDRREWMTIGEI